MNNGSKAGLNADIVAEYGDAATQKFNVMGGAMFGEMAGFDMNLQTIADEVLALVNMEKATRQLRYPLDAIASGTDVEFINSRAAIKAKWVTKYSN
jgi:hypothetical protein